MKKLLAVLLSAIMVFAMVSSVMAEEVPEEYTQVKVFDGTYGFGDAEITSYTNEDQSAFYITFECFDEEQILEGTIDDGIVSVDYDLTGFVSGDAQIIWDDAVASEAAWEVIGGEAAPAEDTENAEGESEEGESEDGESPAIEMPALPTAESPDYTGEIIDYPDKELWFDSTIYGGFMNAYNIVKGNGDESFDIDAFINSELGQLTMERIKYELCLLGDNQWGSDTVIQQWADQGVVEEIHRLGGEAGEFDPNDKEGIADIYLTFVPDYMLEEGNEETYPLVIDYHGGGGSLYESIDHGFVHICYDNQFIVACPEVKGTATDYAEEHLIALIDEIEAKGYPIDRDRVYLVGHSMGGIASIYGSLCHSDAIAAIGASGCSGIFGTTMNFAIRPTEELYAAATPVPMYIQIGTCDNQQWPFPEDVLAGFNQWLKLNGCQEAVAADNLQGFTADETYEEQIDGTTYTFSDFYDSYGNKMVEAVAVTGMPHWTSYSYPTLAWDYMKQFSRGENGVLLVDGVPYDSTK